MRSDNFAFVRPGGSVDHYIHFLTTCLKVFLIIIFILCVLIFFFVLHMDIVETCFLNEHFSERKVQQSQ